MRTLEEAVKALRDAEREVIEANLAVIEYCTRLLWENRILEREVIRSEMKRRADDLNN